MIIIRIELHSAVTGKVSEIGRMMLCNDGSGSKTRGNYSAHVFRKGSNTRVQRRATVEGYARESASVWTLVRKALEAAGF